MAESANELHDLEDVLDQIKQLGHGRGEVSVGDIQEKVAHRSFGPLLVVLGLIVLTPIGGLPGVPTLFGIVVLLVAGQLLLGRSQFWLPGFVTRRSVETERLHKGADKVRPVAKWIDKLLRPRLVALTEGPAVYAVAVACIALALMLPALELVPWGATAPALAITAFALALISNDGLLAALGYAATIASFYVVGSLLVF